MGEAEVFRRLGRGLHGLALGLLAFGAGSLVGGCWNGGRGQPGGATQSVRPALTATPTASSAAKDQALAEAFARQAAVYAQVATTDRAQAAAISVAITTEQQLTAAKAAAATAPALTTVGTSVGTSTPAPAIAVPAAAGKMEGHYQKVAALADQLGANAQALASFHLARAGLAAEGGAQ